MSGFFASIQSNFEKGDQAGRYLAIILLEIAASNEKQCFFDLLSSAGLEHDRSDTVTKERPFRGKKQNRRADLAIVTQSGFDRVLIEIKDEDGKQKPNDAQIRDYIAYINASHDEKAVRPKLLFISKYAPRPEDEEQLRRGGNSVYRLRYGDIYEHLRKPQYENMPICKMLREYLEEVGVIYRALEERDEESLRYLAQQMLGDMPNVKGFPSARAKAAIMGTAQVVDVLLKDALSLSDWLYDLDKTLFSSRAKVYLSVWRDHDPKIFRKQLPPKNYLDA